MSWHGFGLAEIYLRRALRQEGCPICRCVVEAERRYLWFLLNESVNDIGTRRRLAQSLGLCASHALLMCNMEIQEWVTPLGNSIIYEGLAGQVLHQLQEAHKLLEQRDQTPRWKRMWRRSQDRIERLLRPEKICRVCEIGQESARHYAETLVGMLALPEFQELYQGSDGVCLPHLRLMAQTAQDSSGLLYLLEETQQRLAALRQNLKVLQDAICAGGDSVADDFRALRQAISFFGGDGYAISHAAPSCAQLEKRKQNEQKDENLL